MKRSLVKLVAGSLFLAIPLASPLAAFAADLPAPDAVQVLLITSNGSNASIKGQPAMNAAFTREVEVFTGKLKSLLDASGHPTVARNVSNIELSSAGNPVAIALAGLLPKQVSYIGSTYWGPDAANNIVINVVFHAVTYGDAKGPALVGDKDFGKRMLFLPAATGVPLKTAEQLAADFHAHLAATVFK